jgi:hypothetical protein
MAELIENSEIDVNSVITITDECTVTGNHGTIFYFLRLRQYIMCGDTLPVDIGCDVCEQNKLQQRSYYKVCINSEEFLVPKENACIEGYIRKEGEQNLRKGWDDKYVDQVKDYKQAVFEATGLEINTGEIDYARQSEYSRIQRQLGIRK